MRHAAILGLIAGPNDGTVQSTDMTEGEVIALLPKAFN
jgi:hypothetical protein